MAGTRNRLRIRRAGNGRSNRFRAVDDRCHGVDHQPSGLVSGFDTKGFVVSSEKTSQVLRKIEQAARVRGMTLALKRPGGNHSIYDLDGHMVTVPNGNKVTRVEVMYRQLQPKLGKGWWRE